ncbi:hypothetical protein BKA70DRAFT_1369786 [Coprinopsis sp. MPI-PUGE-AT-0042]|nr:hypothetical protein BKA70DRAFT_1369786 [Coprinopsis sp. MPI-PUGE-AT-0042]
MAKDPCSAFLPLRRHDWLAIPTGETVEGTKLNNVYIVGIAIVGVIIFCVAVWLVIRQQRRRAARKKQKKHESVFIPVPRMKSGPPSAPISPLNDPFASQSILTPPPAVALGLPRGRNEIVEYHRQSGNFPKPFSFALARGAGSRLSGLAPPPSPSSTENRPISWVRHSFLSAARSSVVPKRASSRYSVMSTASSSFVGSEPSTGTARKVRQLFSPVLPDELLLTSLGEQLTVIQSFDDGWCVVGRENAHAEWTQKKSLFGGGKNGSIGSAAEGGSAGVELGVVPAWCFLKPVKGLRAERPVRSTSLGITVQMDTGPSRDNLVSWSNF